MRANSFGSLVLALLMVCTVDVASGQVKLKTLAIGDFDFKGDTQFESEFASFGDMLRTEFTKTRRFQLVERSRMEQALKEQGLAETGLIGGNAKQLGSLLGADFVVYGSIAEAVLTQRVRGKTKEYRINLDLGILDAATGEVKLAEDIDAVGFGSIKQVMRTIVEKLVHRSVFAIYPVTIAHAKDGKVMVNYGEGFLEKGAVFDVFGLGEPILDPATGAILALEEELVGQIQIASVTPKFSKGTAISGASELAAGMICRPAAKRDAVPPAATAAASSANGMLRVAVGQFKYSNEFDLQQTRDRSRPVSTTSPSSSGGVVGALGTALLGDTGRKVMGAVQQGSVSDRDQAATAIAKKSDVLRELVTTRLVTSGQFDVIERSRLEEIEGEISLVESDGNFDAASLERVRLLGADYMIFGTITKVAEDIHNTKLLSTKNTVWIDMDVELRVVDVASGSIKAADRVSGSVETTRRGFNILGLIGSGQEQGGAMGDLLAATADAIVRNSTLTLRPIMVIDVDAAEGTVMVNYGEGFVIPSREYNVYSQGKQITDPYTGAIISRKEKLVRRIKPVEILSRVSNCRIVDSTAGENGEIEVGMICRPVPSRGGLRTTRPPSRGTRTRNERGGRREF